MLVPLAPLYTYCHLLLSWLPHQGVPLCQSCWHPEILCACHNAAACKLLPVQRCRLPASALPSHVLHPRLSSLLRCFTGALRPGRLLGACWQQAHPSHQLHHPPPRAGRQEAAGYAGKRMCKSERCTPHKQCWLPLLLVVEVLSVLALIACQLPATLYTAVCCLCDAF